jgi:2-hydroxy-3-oxopropionate reductase
MTIAIIGLGAMGLPMAMVLRRAGYQILGFARTPARVTNAGVTDLHLAQTAAAAVEQCDTVITMLPDSPDVTAVVSGPTGLLAVDGRQRLWIDMSTIAPSTAIGLASLATKAGYRCLDAPVSGGVQGARDGSLTVMVGGPQDVFNEALPILNTLGTTVVRIGDSGAGQIAKACNQMIVANNILTVAEALVLAQRAGVDPGKVREALLGGFAGSRVLQVHGKRMLDHEFNSGFALRLHQKDLGIVLRLASEVGASVTTAMLAKETVDAALKEGLGEADHSAIALIVENRASTRVES